MGFNLDPYTSPIQVFEGNLINIFVLSKSRLTFDKSFNQIWTLKKNTLDISNAFFIISSKFSTLLLSFEGFKSDLKDYIILILI